MPSPKLTMASKSRGITLHEGIEESNLTIVVSVIAIYIKASEQAPIRL